MKRYIQNALAKFIFGEDLSTIKAGIKIAQMPMKMEETIDGPARSDINETLNDHETRIGNCEDYDYAIDELRGEVQEIKTLAEATEVSIDELKEATTIDFAEEFTNAIAQPEFVELIETLIKNEREKAKKKKPKKKKA